MDKDNVKEVKLRMGLTFDSYKILRETINKYSEQHQKTFVVTKCNPITVTDNVEDHVKKYLEKKYVIFSCQFGPERSMESKGIRQTK